MNASAVPARPQKQNPKVLAEGQSSPSPSTIVEQMDTMSTNVPSTASQAQLQEDHPSGSALHAEIGSETPGEAEGDVSAQGKGQSETIRNKVENTQDTKMGESGEAKGSKGEPDGSSANSNINSVREPTECFRLQPYHNQCLAIRARRSDKTQSYPSQATPAKR